MNVDITVLSLTALSIGFFHTLLGPDHYLPFIVMGQARKWSLFKTAIITFLCGLGHVLSSVVLGSLGIALGIGVMKMETFEEFRGNVAAWLLIGFGFAYAVWGVHRAAVKRPHTHTHAHGDETTHVHEHSHLSEHTHAHIDPDHNLTPWILFTIFVFGPCEPLIPILMYPAAKSSVSGLLLVTATFSVTTVATMLGIVMLASWGVSFGRFRKLERFSHVIAGAAICLAGLAIKLLGL